MSKTSFEDRLQRIDVESTPQQPVEQVAERQTRPRTLKLGILCVGIGGAIMALGLLAIRYTSENSDAIRDSGFIGTLAGLGLGGMAAMLIGIAIMIRAAYKMYAFSSDPDGF